MPCFIDIASWHLMPSSECSNTGLVLTLLLNTPHVCYFCPYFAIKSIKYISVMKEFEILIEVSDSLLA
jgi:hypothetical protein